MKQHKVRLKFSCKELRHVQDFKDLLRLYFLGFEMGYLVTGTKNTVHVRMSFDQDTQSWTIAQLQSSSVDLLGAIALQLQSLPDGWATVDRAPVNAPETCQPKFVGTVNTTESPGRLKSGSTSGEPF